MLPIRELDHQGNNFWFENGQFSLRVEHMKETGGKSSVLQWFLWAQQALKHVMQEKSAQMKKCPWNYAVSSEIPVVKIIRTQKKGTSFYRIILLGQD